jgi:thioredoxin-related protein
MAETASTMLELGSLAPDFSLADTNGKNVIRDAAMGERGLLMIFMCNHCPYVIHLREELARLGKDYMAKGFGVVAVNANDVETHPDDSPKKMAQEVKKSGYTFAYLYDETQEVAKAYHAACTPDFFLFDQNKKLVYRGQLDDSRPGNGQPVTGEDLRGAMDALLAGGPISSKQIPSMGCNIKWKAGNAPDYF